MTNHLKKGDRVTWNVGQGETTGTIKKQVTQDTEIDGNSVTASESDPRYLVKNDHTGKVTAHTPEALEKVGNSDHQDISDEERQQKISEFGDAVNMTPKELEKWLQTEESQSVGQKKDDEESIGHKSGKYIIELLSKKQSEYTEDDLEQMKRVISYIHRHTAQKPSGNIEDSRWRYSLMNWGHDPLK